MVEELETVVEVKPPSACWLKNGSQLYVRLAVTWTGFPTVAPLGKLMQTSSADGTAEEPPFRSSSVSACCWM